MGKTPVHIVSNSLRELTITTFTVLKSVLFIQQFVLIRHLTPKRIYRFILEINLSDRPFMTERCR